MTLMKRISDIHSSDDMPAFVLTMLHQMFQRFVIPDIGGIGEFIKMRAERKIK